MLSEIEINDTMRAIKGRFKAASKVMQAADCADSSGVTGFAPQADVASRATCRLRADASWLLRDMAQRAGQLADKLEALKSPPKHATSDRATAKALNYEQLVKWHDLADAATPGPWKDDALESSSDFRVCATGSDEGCIRCLALMLKVDADGCPDDTSRRADAAFIAAAREAVPALLGEVDRLRLAAAEALAFGNYNWTRAESVLRSALEGSP